MAHEVGDAHPEQANEELDTVGLEQQSSVGFRLRTGGPGRLQIEVIAVSRAFVL